MILTDTPLMAQKALNALDAYCKLNQLEVNTSKTKVMVFRRGGKLKSNLKFTLGEEVLEIVNHYCYLGVMFSSSGKFAKAADNAIKKANAAIGNVKDLLVKSKTQNWEARVKLFRATVEATLLYGCEIWSLRYLADLEKIVANFFKSIYNWPLHTPTYMIRAETGIDPLGATAIRRTIEWFGKLKQLPDSSLTKICWERLIDLEKSKSDDLNWFSQLSKILQSIGINPEEVVNAENYKELAARCGDRYTEKISLEDKSRILNSGYNPLYNCILEKDGTQEYLKFSSQFHAIKLISQLRMSGMKIVKLTANGCLYRWYQDRICEACNLQANETMTHFLLHCPAYEPIRSHHLSELISPNLTADLNYINLLSNLDKVKINKVYSFVAASLKIRAFMLE